jgi:hypothetical protein
VTSGSLPKAWRAAEFAEPCGFGGVAYTTGNALFI